MKKSRLISFPSLFLLAALLSCIKDDDSSGGTTNCENSDSYHINNGMACNNTPTAASIYSLNPNGDVIEVTFNYVPPHQVLGMLSSNQRTFSFPARPELATEITQVANTSFSGTSGIIGWIFGIANTGVPFDPVAAEGWTNTSTGEKNYEWNLEVLSTHTNLIYDCNNAHDPMRYHYHGTPIQYLQGIEDGSSHSGLLGYAADGFPIYYKYGYESPDDASSSIVALQSSYSVKEGCRPGDGISAPDGGYDGSYVADYEYVAGKGDLDECNGRWSKTPEFPEGTYVYYITDEFPSVPRCFKGTPSTDYKISL
ncbi:MAG: hypothetical protein CMI35_14690 [Owenweeksia sp.]|mgnify:FL=1|nr:hypothetical protein [Owenweeksia sp.]